MATLTEPDQKITAILRGEPRKVVRITGRFMRANQCEYQGLLVDISSTGAAINTEVEVSNGERIVAVFEKIGSVVGHVVRVMKPGFGPGGFAMQFDASAHKQAKLAAIIATLVSPAPAPPRDGEPETADATTAVAPAPAPKPVATALPPTLQARPGERPVRPTGTTSLTLPSGEVCEARVLDMSFSGATISTAARPPVGSAVAVGKLPATVARHTTDGLVLSLAATGMSDVMRLDRRSYFVKPGTAADWQR